jgi:hypothetical protein
LLLYRHTIASKMIFLGGEFRPFQQLYLRPRLEICMELPAGSLALANINAPGS